MKKLILATASVLALGIASSGVGHAADPYSSSTSTQTPRSTTTMPQQSTQSATSPATVSESQIKQAQQQLKSAGLYKGAVDGKLGTDTQQAIEQFQQQHGLLATGTLDEQTLAALQGNTGRAGSSVKPAGQSSSTSGGLNSNSTNPQHR
jgi:peptidoglycan hydrolase-like protein with peptidoglycan-binding domain